MSTFLLTLNYARSINDNVQKRATGGNSRQPTTHFMRIVGVEVPLYIHYIHKDSLNPRITPPL